MTVVFCAQMIQSIPGQSRGDAHNKATDRTHFLQTLTSYARYEGDM